MNLKLLLWLVAACVLASACKKSATQNGKPDADSVSVAVDADTLHTPQNATDWVGEYKGILPCEDCDGVETSLILYFDNTFTRSQIYIGKGGPYESSGTFRWSERGSIVTLRFADGTEARYKVGDGVLILLDEAGEPFEGDDYMLRK